MKNTTLSGNELFCIEQKGFTIGDVVSGNAIYSLGHLNTLGTAYKGAVGKEIHLATQQASQGWQTAYQRMIAQALSANVIDVYCSTKRYSNYIEYFISGTSIHAQQEHVLFTSALDGQSLYAELDVGYQPRRFVWGNVVYSTGLTQSLVSSLKSLTQGEVKTYTQALNESHDRAFQRLKAMATEANATAVTAIQIYFMPFAKAREMLITGTACCHPLLVESQQHIVTSGLNALEVWSLARLGYAPISLVFGSTVYSLGITSLFHSMKALIHGEIDELAVLMQEGREFALEHLKREAAKLGADQVIGIKIIANSLGNGLIDFFALGTAIKKIPQVTTTSQQLPLQAVIIADNNLHQSVSLIGVGTGTPVKTFLRMLLICAIILFFVYLALKH